MDEVALQRKIGALTGGISSSMVYEQPVGADGAVADPLEIVCKLSLNGKATADKAAELFELLHSVASDAHLDSQASIRNDHVYVTITYT